MTHEASSLTNHIFTFDALTQTMVDIDQPAID